MPFGRKSPLEALALPGVILAYKYSQFRQRRREAASRRVTERELSALHHKIDKLLNKLEESEPELPTSQEDECVICINARATMQTSPCGHRVVCRRCFVKTIQSAVAQRLLPLRCVICRARVNRLTSSSGSWRIQESASSYSVGGKSWSSVGTGNSLGPGGVPQSASSYSMGHEPTSQQQQQLLQQQHHHHRHNHNHTVNGNGRNRVTQSASLYSMQSGTSSLSNSSNATSCSNTSSASSGIDMSSASSSSSVMSSGSSAASINSFNNINRSQHQHNNQSTCQQNGCLGAIPRKPSITSMSSGTTNTYPGRRYTKGRIADLQQNRLPPIKEFRSPIHHQKVPSNTSPAHLNNPRFRYSSYTKSPSSHEMVPLLKDPSPTRISSSSTSQSLKQNITTKQSTKVGLTSKVNPIASKIPIQKNSLTSPQNIKNTNYKKAELNNHPSSSKSYSFSNINCSGIKNNNNKAIQNNRNLHQDEKADNKKNETMEKKKKDEKLKLKAEKEARKEEKRIAKEEERLAKLIAKEEKKKGKREAKELLLAHDGNNKK